jgi:hypothetical protein
MRQALINENADPISNTSRGVGPLALTSGLISQTAPIPAAATRTTPPNTRPMRPATAAPFSPARRRTSHAPNTRPGVSAPPSRDVVELQTSKNTMPAVLSDGRRDGGREVLAGSVELYYRTWHRLLVLRLPDRTDVLFEPSLGLSPAHTRTFTDWRRADYIARGDEQARRTTAADAWEIRYRVDWAGGLRITARMAHSSPSFYDGEVSAKRTEGS